MSTWKEYPIKMLWHHVVNFVNRYRSFSNENDLNKLASIYKTDKNEKHFYTQHYSSHFELFRKLPINLLEIGVGGYKKPYKGGNSLRMWKKYFGKGNIFAIDIHDKAALEEDRIKIFKGSQIDVEFLNEVVDNIGVVDIIVDDGSHINEHVIKSFETLFPKLRDGGLYVIEDTQTSYWSNYGGDSINMNNPKTMINYFKKFIDGLNYKEFILPGYEPSYFDLNINSIHFYHNLIFIYKGDNLEESNIILGNSWPELM